MANLPAFDMDWTRPANMGFGYAHTNAIQAVANSTNGSVLSGSGVIQGALGAEANVAILLSEPTGSFIATAKTQGPTGVYNFTGLAAGNYAVVALDTDGAYRAKVIHTVVP